MLVACSSIVSVESFYFRSELVNKSEELYSISKYVLSHDLRDLPL